MKIAFVHLYLATESGDPRMFWHIVQNVQALGHDVAVFTGEFDPKAFPKLHAGLSVTAVGALGSRPRPARTSFLDRIRARLAESRWAKTMVQGIEAKLPPDLDVLVCQNDESYELGLRYGAHHKGVRTVWIMNNAPFYSAPKTNPLVGLLSRMLAWWNKRRVAHYLRGIDVVVVHDAERGRLAATLGARPVILSIPVDFEHFYQSVRVRAADDRRVRFLGIGSLSPFRKFEDIINAAASLKKRGYAPEVALVCKEFWGEASYKNELVNLVVRLGLETEVRFFFEGVGDEELRKLQSESDIFVFAQHENIWGMSAVECMAAGLPLIVSKTTSVAEILHDGENAIFVSPGAPGEIADAAERLVRDPAAYARIAASGQSFVKETLNWQRYAQNFLAAVPEKKARP